MNYVIRRPNQEDINNLCKNIRKADIEEIYKFSGRSVEEVLKLTPNIKENHYVLIVNDKLVAMYGVAEHPGIDNNVIWMLATEDFDKYKIIFRNICKKVVEEMISNYDYVYNYVYSKHLKSLKWLKWLGFKVFDPEPIGLNGELFCKFEMIKKNV